ncbi:MAG: hypothetical protein EOR99_33770 [Mesorhizobium sp.]|nr:MAG: hypothetical protein EOR99_33770 [Mesorhizobium sp.]
MALEGLQLKPPDPTQIVREETKRWLSSYEPGASVSLVARRHDINANLLFTWRRQMRASALAASPLEMILIEVTSPSYARRPV